MSIYSQFYGRLPASRGMRVLFLVVLGISAGAVFYVVSPDARVILTLRLCGIHSDHFEKVECAFATIRDELMQNGVASGVGTFIIANTMYRNALDVDCHAAVHRVGDMAYYDLFKNNPDFSDYEFPPETTVCGTGFYHGFFEHLIQDNPRPEFIVKTCNYFKKADPQYFKRISITCFHAAGHGLIRANADQVPRALWGNPAPFVDLPLRVCDLMKGVTANELNLCKTGVMSIFIQMNSFENYGFSRKKAFDICHSLASSQWETCYRMAALMISQFQSDYKPAWLGCSGAAPALRRACIVYIPIGLFTNGIHPRSYQSSLDFCSAVAVGNVEEGRFCYEKLGQTLTHQYRDPLYAPDCARFPVEYRDFCTSPKSWIP